MSKKQENPPPLKLSPDTIIAQEVMSKHVNRAVSLIKKTPSRSTKPIKPNLYFTNNYETVENILFIVKQSIIYCCTKKEKHRLQTLCSSLDKTARLGLPENTITKFNSGNIHVLLLNIYMHNTGFHLKPQSKEYNIIFFDIPLMTYRAEVMQAIERFK